MSDEKDDNWEMPKPVFRSTGGSVPRNLEDTISLSFAPNKEPVEVDEDDDILGIMDSKDGGELYRQPDGRDNENILETEAANEIAGSMGSDPVLASAPPAPMNLTAKDAVRQPKQIDPRRADFLTYVAMVIIGAGLFVAAIYYYFWPLPPVR